MNAENNGPMRVEGEIDAALKMLGETQPPAAMVSRIHQNLETVAMSQRARSSRWFLIPAAGIAMAALALVAILAQLHRTRGIPKSTVAIARMTATAPTPRATTAIRSTPVSTGNSRERKPSLQSVVVRRTRRRQPKYRHVANLFSYPLTRQEELLVQFAKISKPEDLQALNPEYQAKIEAQQEAEFDAYLKSGDSSSTQNAPQTNDSSEE